MTDAPIFLTRFERILIENAGSLDGGLPVMDGTIDIDGDGIDDLIFGSDTSGEVSIFFGDAALQTSGLSLADLDGADGFVIEGGVDANRFGHEISAGGDFNGDGVQDFSISGTRIFTRSDDSSTDPGEVILLFGQSAPLNSNPREVATDIADLRLTGIAPNDGFGAATFFADVNGDAFDDLIIGAPGRDATSTGGGFQAGEVYVVFGGAAVTGDIAPAALDGTDGFRLNGFNQFDFIGDEMQSVGDFNADGFEDFAIVALGQDLLEEAEGSAYLIFGAANGFAADIDLRTLDGEDGLRLFSSNSTERLEMVIGGSGDFNGDGFDDIVLGAGTGKAAGTAELGQVSVIFGTDAAQNAEFDLESVNGENGFQVFGGRNSDRFGQSVAFGEDFNGDGFSDIVIGAPEADRLSSRVEYGEVSILLGRAEEPTNGALKTITQLIGDGVISIDGRSFRENRDKELGRDVNFIGDIDGDGFADVAITARAENGVSEVHVIFGLPTLQDNSGTAVESGTTEFNVFADAKFAPLNAPITKINGHDVQNGDQIALENGSAIEIVDAAAGTLRYTPNTDFIALPEGETDRDAFLFSVDDGRGVRFDITVIGLDSEGDLLIGSNSDDVLNGGIGDDVIVDDQGADRLNGESGDDDLSGGRNDDVLDGGAGADIMRGGAGRDRYFVDSLGDQVIELPGEGSDLVEASGAFTFVLPNNVESLTLIGDTDANGNNGENRINGGDGANTIRGGGGRDIIDGSDGDDILLGQVGDDVLRGGAGLDSLNGAEGDDAILGGDDADTIIGGDGDDILMGEGGDDHLIGAAGNDRLIAGLGDNLLIGGDGDDFLIGFRGLELLNTEFAQDFGTISPVFFSNRLEGGQGNDTYIVGSDAETIIEEAGAGTDTILLPGSLFFPAPANIEILRAISDTGIIMTGNAEDNLIVGSAGDDFINGRGGIDIMGGGLGDDVYAFELGETVIEAASGGVDTINFDSDAATAGVTIANQRNVETLVIRGSNDVNATGTSGAEHISGSEGENSIKGGSGDDLLQGGGGDDLLIGHGGRDTLDGGTGDDRIKAGRDGDTIIYRPGDGRDRIFDFGGEDRLDISAFGFNFLTDIVPLLRETARGEVFINFGGGDVVKLVGFPTIFLDDNDFIL